MNKIFLSLLLAVSISAISAQTTVGIIGDKFTINGECTFKDKVWRGISIEGLLPNSRMVNGVFDDLNPATRNTFVYPDTKVWSAERNTAEFVDAMPLWRESGMLAIAMNLQGGNPFAYNNDKSQKWINSPYDEKGELRQAYLDRFEMIAERANELDMAIILGLFYFGQDEKLEDEAAIINATRNIIEWIHQKGWRNIIIEVNNECDIFYDHEILKPARVHELITLVHELTPEGKQPLLVGTSFSGGNIPTEKIAEISDFILIHGNGVKTPEGIIEQVGKVQALLRERVKPIVYNEDDHFDFDKPFNNFVAATKMHASWGYFDYRMEGEGYEAGFQSIPTDWTISSERKRGFFGLLKEWSDL